GLSALFFPNGQASMDSITPGELLGRWERRLVVDTYDGQSPGAQPAYASGQPSRPIARDCEVDNHRQQWYPEQKHQNDQVWFSSIQRGQRRRLVYHELYRRLAGWISAEVRESGVQQEHLRDRARHTHTRHVAHLLPAVARGAMRRVDFQHHLPLVGGVDNDR